MELSRLSKVDLRKAWPREASDFTNWLAEEENLRLLSDEIGIDLDLALLETEASVGRFAVDILAEEDTTGRRVVIENQLEPTNHDHLGKLITYACGLEAEIVIWIVKQVRDEHKQAVDWLNDHTDEDINIFAIEMELWQIGESPYAPKFRIVSQPNDWTKAIKASTARSALSETKLMQHDFWTQFREYASARGSTLRLRTPRPQHWYDVSIGVSKAHLSVIVDTLAEQIRCELYIPDSMELYEALHSDREEIEASMEHELEWMDLPGKKASRVCVLRAMDITDPDTWSECFAWLLRAAEQFRDAFGPRIAKLAL